MTDLSTKLPGLKLENPIMPASGCFGYGREFAEFMDISNLGACIVKSITPEPREGNPGPRIAETPGGMLNAIGLQNPGMENIEKDLVWLEQQNVPIICNVAAYSEEGYVAVTEKLCQIDAVDALEINISCPNVKQGGITFGTNPDVAFQLTKKIKEVATKPIYVKLSPNVTDIVEMALAVEEAGADAISMINTLIGMRLDLKTGKPILANRTGGLSGPAIFPVAIRMIYDVYRHVHIPIIGMGGVSSVEDAIEMIYAGASAVAIGTYNFINPKICIEIIDQLPKKMSTLNFNSIEEMIGFAHKEEI